MQSIKATGATAKSPKLVAMLFARAEATHMADQATRVAELTNHFHVSPDAKMGRGAKFRKLMPVMNEVTNPATAADVQAAPLKSLESCFLMLLARPTARSTLSGAKQGRT
jgi:hypothetical protein